MKRNLRLRVRLLGLFCELIDILRVFVQNNGKYGIRCGAVLAGPTLSLPLYYMISMRLLSIIPQKVLKQSVWELIKDRFVVVVARPERSVTQSGLGRVFRVSNTNTHSGIYKLRVGFESGPTGFG